MRLARIRKGRIWLSPKLKGEQRRHVLRHMKVFRECRGKGFPRQKSILLARKAEHRGLSKHEVHVYEGELGALARYGNRKGYK